MSNHNDLKNYLYHYVRETGVTNEVWQAILEVWRTVKAEKITVEAKSLASCYGSNEMMIGKTVVVQDDGTDRFIERVCRSFNHYGKKSGKHFTFKLDFYGKRKSLHVTRLR